MSQSSVLTPYRMDSWLVSCARPFRPSASRLIPGVINKHSSVWTNLRVIRFTKPGLPSRLIV